MADYPNMMGFCFGVPLLAAQVMCFMLSMLLSSSDNHGHKGPWLLIASGAVGALASSVSIYYAACAVGYF
jgi:hypothetical protein